MNWLNKILLNGFGERNLDDFINVELLEDRLLKNKTLICTWVLRIRVSCYNLVAFIKAHF